MSASTAGGPELSVRAPEGRRFLFGGAAVGSGAAFTGPLVSSGAALVVLRPVRIGFDPSVNS